MERTTKRIRVEEPTGMDIDTRYKRKAEVLEEPIQITLNQLTPMEVDAPFIFFPMPELIRAEKMEN